MFTGSLLKVVDNSGVLLVKLLKRYSKFEYIKIGDLLLVSCKNVVTLKKYIKGQKLKVLVIHLKRPLKRGCYHLKCDSNNVVVLKDNMDLKATRVKGVIFSELRNSQFSKIVSLGDFIF